MTEADSAPIWVEAATGRCPVVFAAALADVGPLARRHLRGGRVMVVTDVNVAPLFLDATVGSLAGVGFEVSTHVVAAGEATKGVAGLTELWQAFFDAGLTRADAVVALGGGVVGDLTGFAAGTFLRGIDVVQVPTTLLAQVDSAIGGKTAIDLPSGKNMAGLIRQPAAVIVDPSLAAHLPARDYASGMGEVIKYGLIGDAGLWRGLLARAAAGETGPLGVDHLRRCVRIKADVVGADEGDDGVRKTLNFGHTFGHAMEKLRDFTGLLHGEAVACGMIMALLIGEDLGVTDPALLPGLVTVMRAWGLPVDAGFDPVALAAAAAGDKKVSGSEISFVLVPEAGRAVLRSIPVERLTELTATAWPRYAALADAAR